MATFALHSKTDLLNLSSSLRMHSQQSLSSYSVFLIPWSTFANKSSRAKVFHIMKVESKSISYHAFFLCFLFVLVLTAGQGEREQSASTWYQFLSRTNCLEPLPDCLPSLALEYSSTTVDVLLREDATSCVESRLLEACGDNVLRITQPSSRINLWKDTSSKAKVPHIIREEGKGILWHAFPLPLLLSVGQGERKQLVGTRLNKDTDHHLYLVPACHTEEPSREGCRAIVICFSSPFPCTIRCKKSLS